MDLSNFEKHNIEVLRGELKARAGWRRMVSGLGSIIYGFSIESPNTTEVYHYIVSQETNGDGYIGVYEEDFNLLYTFNLGKIPEDAPIYYGVQNRQILINSPSLNFPLYGVVGGGLTIAVKQESINPDTTAINIPRGIICSFGDRFCIAQDSILFFNDPGVEPRTFTGENTIALPSTIYHIEQTDDGFLAAFCASGIYLIPKDALGQGQDVVGFISTIPGFEAIDYRCAASGNGITVGLVKDGVALIQDQMKLFPIEAYHAKRYFTEYVLPEDFRFGKVHKTANGFLVAYADHAVVLDIKNQYSSWVYNDANNSVMAVLKTRDGEDLYLLDDGTVAYPKGTRDDYNATNDVDGYAAGDLDTDPQLSPMVRYVTTSSDNSNYPQFAYVRGRAAAGSTKYTPGYGILIGTDVWSNVAPNLYERELRSVRHSFAVRTDMISIEVGAIGSGRTIGDVDVETKPSGPTRPDNS